MLLLWQFLIMSLLTIVKSQMIHSVDRMTDAIWNQATLADHLQDYIISEERRIRRLELSVQKLRTASLTKKMNRRELEEQMSHPVRVLRFIVEVYEDVENVRLSIDHSLLSAEFNETLQKLPSHQDYVDAVQAIVRLQEVYAEAADFSKPQGDNYKDVLTADELLDIGKICVDNENYHGGLNNIKRAKEKYEEAENLKSAMLAYDYLAFIMYEQHNTDYALNYTYDLLNYYENSLDEDPEVAERLRSNIDLYVEELGGTEKAMEAIKLLRPYTNELVGHDNNYHKLCRGERVEVPDKDTKPLKCHLYTNNNHPLLILSPAKKEDINTATGLSYFHHVLTDREIEFLQKTASERFEDSQLAPSKEDLENPEKKKIEDAAGFSDNKVRSSNTGWIADDVDVKISALSKRISAILNLNLNSSEAFQVLSYGIGGFYLPHFDWGGSDQDDQPFVGYDGDRIATWIFYLNDIKRGGATVFPNIGATVWPEKGGAAFWRNLHQNGTGNQLTLHAACPLLEGYKWVSNKWFHTVGNEQAWPCGLDQAL